MDMSGSFTYYVISEDVGMLFHELPEDAFDDEANQVFRKVTLSDESALQPGYGKRIDEVIRMFPEVDNPKIEDGYRVKAEVTIGWLRTLNVLAGHLQGQYRVRNPEFRGKFSGQ